MGISHTHGFFKWAGIVSLLGVCSLTHANQTVFPTGTTIYRPDECYSSYILLVDQSDLGNHASAKVRARSKHTDDVRLIDMNGNVLHTWKVPPGFNKRCRLLPNGHLLYNDHHYKVYEYDWDGKVLWSYEGIKAVNDVRLLPNNNRLLVAHEPLPEEFQKQVKDVEIAPWWGPRKRGSEERQKGCDIYEITPDNKIVWEWHAHNHLDLNRYSPVTPEGDWLHVNSIAPLPENKWHDAGDKRFKPGNILLNPRNIDKLCIIDKDTKKIVWEWTHDYKGGLAHCHEPEMIEKGLPGAGNIILFDNGLFPRHRLHCGQSIIVEFNPVTKKIVWKYETEGYANIKFFSKSMGTQKRLPNGNTFISEDNTGRIFQVKSDKEVDGVIVWEYVNRGGTCRPSPIPYDYCPQLRAYPKPPEYAVTPPNNLEWHIVPDVFREQLGKTFEIGEETEVDKQRGNDSGKNK